MTDLSWMVSWLDALPGWTTYLGLTGLAYCLSLLLWLGVTEDDHHG